ncbi:MAG: hypothetical protein Q9187_003151 [Circinaria calcarea]
MAKNLQSKIPKGDTLLIHDRNAESTAQFVQKVGSGTQTEGMGAEVEVLGTPRDVAERAALFPQPPTAPNASSSTAPPSTRPLAVKSPTQFTAPTKAVSSTLPCQAG